MWAKHDVFRPPLHTCYHLQPQHLPRFLILTHLLPPRGELVTHLHQGLWLHSATKINVRARLTQQTCNNEMKCICDPDYTGKDCSVFDPIPIPTPSEGPEKYRGKHTRPVRLGIKSGCLYEIHWNKKKNRETMMKKQKED